MACTSGMIVVTFGRCLGHAGFAAELLGIVAAHPVAGSGNDPIQTVTRFYGMPGARKVLDIAPKLQDLYGPGARSCSVFCSFFSFGRFDSGRKSICQMTYPCGSAEVLSVEEWREEPILMRCPGRHDEKALPLDRHLAERVQR
jgi:hypothetical protein